MNRQDVANGKEASAILIRPLGVSTNRIGWDALFVSKFPNNSKTHLTVEFSFSPKEGVFADQLPLFSIWRTDPTIQGGLRPSFRVISDPRIGRRDHAVFISVVLRFILGTNQRAITNGCSPWSVRVAGAFVRHSHPSFRYHMYSAPMVAP